MAKTKGVNYFEVLSGMTDCVCRAAEKLDAFIGDYTDVDRKAEEIHTIEHECDDLLHLMISELGSSFITPIDREDLTDLARVLDTVTDRIEEVAMDFEMLCVDRMREGVGEMSKIIVKIGKALHKAVCEFENFKHSKVIIDYIIDINQLEHEADLQYKAIMTKLMLDDNISPKDLLRWTRIFDTLEMVPDACEDAADVLEALVCKNK
jgi:predicted phosphate transport protein (TIGR00153 family)